MMLPNHAFPRTRKDGAPLNAGVGRHVGDTLPEAKT